LVGAVGYAALCQRFRYQRMPLLVMFDAKHLPGELREENCRASRSPFEHLSTASEVML